jgi:hypothetical protein
MKVDLARTTDGPQRLSNKITIYGWSHAGLCGRPMMMRWPRATAQVLPGGRVTPANSLICRDEVQPSSELSGSGGLGCRP